jgi:hypothetical protein
VIYSPSKPDRRSALPGDSSTAVGLAIEAAVGAEPLSAILGRVMVALLGAVPIEEVEPSERAAIRRGLDDETAGRPRP